MSEHGGLLGFLSEALELQQQFGGSFDEALAKQRELAAERMKEAEREAAMANVIEVDFRKGRAVAEC
jgi:Flp pilus assembly protein TadB